MSGKELYQPFDQPFDQSFDQPFDQPFYQLRNQPTQAVAQETSQTVNEQFEMSSTDQVARRRYKLEISEASKLWPVN